MARLCSMKPYQRDTNAHHDCGHYDPRCITKLIESYRCCSEMIRINSELFYHNELVCHQPRDEVLVQSNALNHNVEFPVMFHGLKGDDVQERDNPSWCNHAEAIQCIIYLLWLYRNGVKPDEIGIITPYRKQVDVIRKVVRLYKKPVCKIATIEEFQGGERRVTINSFSVFLINFFLLNLGNYLVHGSVIGIKS